MEQFLDLMIGGEEFDAWELSVSEFIAHAGLGNTGPVAIPGVHSRQFRYGGIRPVARRHPHAEGL